MKEIIMYSQASWSRCHAARVWLNQLGRAFVVRDVYGTPGAAKELRDLHVGRLPAFVIGDNVVEGFDRMAILHALHVTGEVTWCTDGELHKVAACIEVVKRRLVAICGSCSGCWVVKRRRKVET